MRLLPLLATLGAALVVGHANAAVPPSTPGYQINLGTSPVPPSYVYGQVPMWLDTTTMIAGVNGLTPLPRPVSNESPLPVTPASGSPGTSASSPSYVTDANSAAFGDWPTLTSPAGTYTTPAKTRSIGILVTVAGNVVFASSSGNSMTVPVVVGYQTFPFVPTTFTTTATATFYALQ